MLPILESTDTRALRRLLDRTPDDHGRLEPAVRDILAAVRARGDKALVEFARKFDHLEGPIELSPAEIHAGAEDCPRHVRAAIRKAARHIRMVARAQVPATWTKQVAPGVKVSQRVVAARTRRLLRPRRALPAPVVAADGCGDGPRGRRAGSDRGVSAAGRGGARRGGRSRRGPRLPARWRTGDRGDGLRHGDRAARGQDRRTGQRLRRAGQGAGGSRLRHRFLRRTERDRRGRQLRRSRRGSPPICWRRPSTTSMRAPSSSRRRAGSRSRSRAPSRRSWPGPMRRARRHATRSRAMARSS